MSVPAGERLAADDRAPATPSAGSALAVTGLVKRYGERVAVNGLSFTVDRGTVFALLGPNGAGKTSTVEVCEGFRRADAGQVRVLGLDPVRDAATLRPRVGVMPQTGGAYMGAKAAEMLRLVASYARHPLDPDELLDLLDLRSVAGTKYRALSGGQRQRLSLAMAVVARPELVFLDEPTAGLDPRARRGTWELVEALRRDGVTVVLTTHYMEEAERLADQVVVIDRGRSVAAGTPVELTRHNAGGQLWFHAAAGLDLADLRAKLPVVCVASEPTAGGYLVEGPVTPDLLATITAWCAARDVLVSELRVERRSLEDVYLELTGQEASP